ncbi:N-acetylgalactosamine-6-sulfatase [Planctomyces bekefii]|uniref:N-acetylgalactosamine-6-sulfatase n=1 Tax=Planctomyces bekefii TaxID=1653850 RepID=A0A5C6M855_9PLAN|nr:N-acetylgalactosamine-6-sulfatase [Planctomyces bekefii]
MLLTCLVTSVLAQPARPSLPVRPNVVVFLADDAGWGDCSHSGNRTVSTPAIDSIAQGGVSLDRFFVCPVCAPTRAEFLTGRYHSRGGVRGVSLGEERLDLTERTVADAFRAAGYATGAFGKWHNGSQWPYHPRARGFDRYFGHTAGHWGEYFDAPLEDDGRMVRTSGYIVDVCVERAEVFIREQQDRPFFCFIPFTTPHSPWAVPAADWERFRERELLQRGANPDREKPDETRCVLAMMEHQDRCVGRILQTLQQCGVRDNTIVLYFSDNGPNTARWNGGMRGQKGTVDEGGLRSVCYLSWPAGLPQGLVVPQIAGAIDLLPTLTALAGVSRVGDLPLDGKDLSPLFSGASVEWPDRTIFSVWGGRVSARNQRFRLDDVGRLYDMQVDPGQTMPVNAAQAGIAAQLQREVQEWRKEVLPENPNLLRKLAGAVDPRPFTVGYAEFPITMLPARDGQPHGGVKRSSNAPNCSYFVNWKTKNDSIVWNVDVHTAGRYEVVIDYTCPLADSGSVVQLACGESRLRGKVATGWDPPLYTNQDTLPRPHGESQMKEFRPLPLGQVELQSGLQQLELRAVEIPGDSVMDLRRITLTLIQP